jgi:hypothetical protein
MKIRGVTLPGMTLRRILLLAGFGLGLWLAIAVWLSGREDLPAPPNGAPAVFVGGAAVGQRIDSKSWSAAYDKIVTSADQTKLDLDGVHDGVIYKHGKPYLRVRAAHLTVNTVTHDFAATGPIHVEMVAPPRRSFDTTAANWTDATQKLSMPRPITIRSGAERPLIIGSMEFNVLTGQIELRHVSGAVRFK